MDADPVASHRHCVSEVLQHSCPPLARSAWNRRNSLASVSGALSTVCFSRPSARAADDQSRQRLRLGNARVQATEPAISLAVQRDSHRASRLADVAHADKRRHILCGHRSPTAGEIRLTGRFGERGRRAGLCRARPVESCACGVANADDSSPSHCVGVHIALQRLGGADQLEEATERTATRTTGWRSCLFAPQLKFRR